MKLGRLPRPHRSYGHLDMRASVEARNDRPLYGQHHAPAMMRRLLSRHHAIGAIARSASMADLSCL